MPFYTYALWHNDDEGRAKYCLIISDNRASADELYRGIQEQMVFNKGSVEFKRLRRLSPQMWTWGATGTDDLRELIDYINKGDNQYIQERLKRLRGRVFIRELGDFDDGSGAWPIIPPYELADHVNKQTFFIRNKLNPAQFWTEDSSGYIGLSTERRSRFRIELPDGDKMFNGEQPLLVAKDRVRLTLIRNETSGQADEVRLYIEDNTGFITTQRKANAEVEFGNLNGGFAIYNSTKGSISGWPALQSTSLGEAWELV
ncbi:hypothetical protein BJX68DRAFT_261002 [Aspergillus pseudodeflectus]|uniref:Uncharacterized protein n=1 Tax=Aspergillus pseudodeflectus TaxID=176178 RepID=A0ABR4L669_9EURO